MSKHRSNDAAGIVAVVIAAIVIIGIPIAWLWFEYRRFRVAKPPFEPTPHELSQAMVAQDRQQATKADLTAIDDVATGLDLRVRRDGYYGIHSVYLARRRMKAFLLKGGIRTKDRVAKMNAAKIMTAELVLPKEDERTISNYILELCTGATAPQTFE